MGKYIALGNGPEAKEVSAKTALLAKDARNGAPPSEECARGVKINVNGNGQECPFHTGVALLR